MDEEWKQFIETAAKIYFVSNRGDVESEYKSCGRRRPLKLFLDRHGYYYAVINEKWLAAHRLVLSAFVGPCPEGWEGAHLNGIRTDNRVENLIWKTAKDNAADRIRHLTQANGERAGGAKLSDAEVQSLRAFQDAYHLSDLTVARICGVPRQTVYNLRVARTRCRPTYGPGLGRPSR